MVKKILKYPGPFPISNAIVDNHQFTMEISGQIGVDSTGQLVEGIEKQTAVTLDNVKKILGEIGWDLTNITKTRVYMSDMEVYAAMNKTYSEYFTKDFPARVTMAVKELPRKALVEIECTATGDNIKQ